MLTDKVFIVTGAAGAIAGSINAAFHAAGAKLALVDRHVVETPFGVTFQADLDSPIGARHMVNTVLERHGRIDGLIHTVGAFQPSSVLEYDPQIFEAMLNVNLRTLVHASSAVLPELVNTHGFLGGIAAGQAARGAGAGAALYAAAKASVAVYLKSVAAEVKSVRSGVVYPMGTVDTPANVRAMPEANTDTWIDPLEIAQSFVFMASRGARGRVLEIEIYPAA